VARIAGTTTIARSPDDVFDVLADPRHEPAYNPVVVSARKMTPGPVGAGTRYAQQVRSLGSTRGVDIELLEYDRPARLRWHITSAGMDVHGDIRIRPDSTGSAVDWDWRLTPRGWVRLTGPLAAALGARLERGVWRRLKAYLESGDGTGRAGGRPDQRATGRGVKALLGRLFPPQDYAVAARYRPPTGWYWRLNRIGVPLTSLGLAPRDAVTLEVPGRSSGRLRRTPVLVTEHEGCRYLVALAGESQWVRNVRAAHGHAALRRRGSRRIRLEEVPASQRAPVLAAYVAAGYRRSGSEGGRLAARSNFGLEEPRLEQLARIADRYPVFRVADDPPEPGPSPGAPASATGRRG
jgi:hypothetical protein